MKSKGLKVIGLEDKAAGGQPAPLEEIDPFTFFANFNRGISAANRRDNWLYLKERWALVAEAPTDFEGLPRFNNQNSWLFPFAPKRHREHVPLLWKIAESAAKGGVESLESDLFNRCLELAKVSIRSLTVGLFWINPEHYLPAYDTIWLYARGRGVDAKPLDYRSYAAWLGKVGETMGCNFPQISHDACRFQSSRSPDVGSPGPNSPAEQLGAPFDSIFSSAREANFHFDLLGWTLQKLGVSQSSACEDPRIALTLPKRGHCKLRLNFGYWAILSIYSSQGYSKTLQFVCQQDRVPVPAEFSANAAFAEAIEGRVFILAHVPPSFMEDERSEVRAEFGASLLHVANRFASWGRSPWRGKHRPELATMVFDLAERGRLLREGLPPGNSDADGDDTPEEAQQGKSEATTRHWWLNANPKIWKMDEMPIGQKELYTSHNKRGNKRQKYRHFREVKPGDLVVGYMTSPNREIVAFCKISKGLHSTSAGEVVEFEKTEQLERGIPFDMLRANPKLAHCAALSGSQGSLFSLTQEEYGEIRHLAESRHATLPDGVVVFDRAKAMEGVFMAETQFDQMVAALRERKNLVLQGAPGVGKTFIARRIAHALVGSNDPRRVATIQFHQSYSYEDFIQGFRPNAKGTFDLRCGVFHRFCSLARREEARKIPHVFIIDEINRGNLAKIFGELLMLIEADKRGREHAMPLAYSQEGDEPFYIPDNLHLIGMMNTADRSLAFVDYALRRRFRFITLRPEFSSTGFGARLRAAGADAPLVEKIIDRMSKLNNAIAEDSTNLGPAYQIGHSYFCPGSDVTPDEAWYRRVVEGEIIPLIQEYWFDNEAQVERQSGMLLA